MTNSTTWAPDWQSRLLEKVRAIGYHTVTEFLSAHPAEPYVTMARKLGNTAAVQLLRVQRLEIEDEAGFRRAAMDCMARELATHLPKGWGIPTEIPEVPLDSMWTHLAAHGPLKPNEIEDRIAFQTAGVYADWMSLLREYDSATIEPRADAVWAALKNLRPPTGWIPHGPNDPIIVRAFDVGWPTSP